MTDAKLMLLAFRQMVKSDLQGGTVSLGNAAYDCTIGIFSKRDVLVNGGVSPMMIGDVQVALEDFPDGTEFRFGQNVTVVPNTGKTRQCTIFTTDYSGPLVVLNLHDQNDGA
jgi:hypothetical protein